VNIKNGIFTLSLDFELYWGVRDKRRIENYKENLKGVKFAIKKMLELFNKYEIHATWATVGMLFASNKDELRAYYPKLKPKYFNTNLSPFAYVNKLNMLEHEYHFAPQLINLISKYRNQEIGTHTFSHYYCLEVGQGRNEFQSDIQSAITIAKLKNITIKSLVFPRNQWKANYLQVLKKFGIKCYRGNEDGWLYKAVNETEKNLFRRAIRLLDAYINLTGANSYNLETIAKTKPYNIPSSRFLRPVSKTFSTFENLRKLRIFNSIKYAARKKELFHLWWHPHNFGINTDKNIQVLEDILKFYMDMNKRYGMQSLNMGEVSQLVYEGT